MAEYRLDKYITLDGRYSRKDAKSVITHGHVAVNGSVIRASDYKVNDESDSIAIDGTVINNSKFVYIMMNKPSGYLSATEDAKDKTFLDLMEKRYVKLKIFPAGRLDKDAEGLLLLTNDGEYAHKVMSPKHHVDKRYYVKVEGVLTERCVSLIEKGIVLKNGYSCDPGKLEIISTDEGIVTIHEGKFHQVKRMMDTVGNPVIYLKRLSIGKLELDPALSVGEYRELSLEEIQKVLQ